MRYSAITTTGKCRFTFWKLGSMQSGFDENHRKSLHGANISRQSHKIYEFLKNVYDLGTFTEDLPGRKLVGLLLSGPTDLNSLYKQIM